MLHEQDRQSKCISNEEEITFGEFSGDVQFDLHTTFEVTAVISNLTVLFLCQLADLHQIYIDYIV